ncbi:hypothetical protein POM88_017919 [Heracleum sosnowskyi]|uniref:Leucine-rich repeat-containing protein n=1 Tax=Heracleum sosnowskyi TaxID=360622 RepID=A0AAD8IRS9_9APIA|nr:hypothetical protein POM88_017919 [Heracleum sosnowskyi]
MYRCITFILREGDSREHNKSLRISVVLSGEQAPGGHTVISEFVYLRDNLLSTLEGIEILKRVKVLDLSFNDFKGPGFEPLENWKALQQLYLAGNQITSLVSLLELPNFCSVNFTFQDCSLAERKKQKLQLQIFLPLIAYLQQCLMISRHKSRLYDEVVLSEILMKKSFALYLPIPTHTLDRELELDTFFLQCFAFYQV